MDTDGNGYICKREMVNAYKQLGCTEAEAKEMAKVSVHAVQACILVHLWQFEKIVAKLKYCSECVLWIGFRPKWGPMSEEITIDDFV